MNCAKCGNPNADGTRFCANCGAALGGDAAQPASAPGHASSAESVEAGATASAAWQDVKSQLPGLLQRVKNILLEPNAEWPVIAAETTPAAKLYTGYVCPLAAIGPIASIIGMSLVGIDAGFLGTVRTPIVSSVSYAVIAFILALVGVFVLALIIDALAPTFSGEKSQGQALKVAAYSYTPAWLAGILGVIPMLSLLGVIAALYGLYLLYLGLPVLMKAPKEKAVGYTAVVVICAIVLGVVLGAISGTVMGASGMSLMGMHGGAFGQYAGARRLEALGTTVNTGARCEGKPRYGIFGFGSLISDPGEELTKATVSRQDLQTPFAVEYGRSSNTRGGAPTLVPVNTGGAKVKATVFVLKDSISEQEAENILYRRELHQVGSGRTYNPLAKPKKIASWLQPGQPYRVGEHFLHGLRRFGKAQESYACAARDVGRRQRTQS